MKSLYEENKNSMKFIQLDDLIGEMSPFDLIYN